MRRLTLRMSIEVSKIGHVLIFSRCQSCAENVSKFAPPYTLESDLQRENNRAPKEVIPFKINNL